MPNLSLQDFEKIHQLSEEMDQFPPSHFTDENILSWAKYFGIAPKNLHEYTTKTGEILRIAVNMAKKDQNIEPLETEKPFAIHSNQANRSINPIFNTEIFDFLWLQTLLILVPQSDSNLLDREFSAYFKMAAALKNAEEIAEDLKAFCLHYDNPQEPCTLYNATITLIQELKIAIEARDLDSCKAAYTKIYKLNRGGLDTPEIKSILKKASPEIKDQFLLSEEISKASYLEEDQNSQDHSGDPEAFKRSIQTKIAKIAEKFGKEDLSFFKSLEIKFDPSQEETFMAQLKTLLSNIAQAHPETSEKITGSTT